MYDLTEVNNTVSQLSSEWESFKTKSDSAKMQHNKYVVENVSTESKEHKAAFRSYLTKGIDNNLGVFETKGLTSNTDSEGGYLVTREVSKYINSTILGNSPFRKLASNETISSDSLDLLEESSTTSAGWTAENAILPETGAPKVSKKKINVHELYAQPKATQKLLDDSEINIEKWLSERIADTFAAKENDAFINGDGLGKPRGILSYNESKIQQITSSTKGQVTVESLFNLYYSLKETYASKAVFLMHRSVIQAVRMLKDPKSGQFLWSPGLIAGTPDTLLGVPVVQCSEMPMMQEGALVIALADFNAAYKIVDRQGVKVLRDPFTEKPFVKFYATKRVGGDVVNYDAIKLLKI